MPVMDPLKDFLLAHSIPPRSHFSTGLVKFQLAEDLLGSSSWELDGGNTVLQNELVAGCGFCCRNQLTFSRSGPFSMYLIFNSGRQLL
jgi:hypothetical protein